MGSPCNPAIKCECGCHTFNIYHLKCASTDTSVTVGHGIEGQFLIECTNCNKDAVIGMHTTFEVSGEVYEASWGLDRPKTPTEE